MLNSYSVFNVAACASLGSLITPGIDVNLFQTAVKRLQNRFNTYAATCPAPYIAPGLIITPEIRRQSELYLPVADIAGTFNRLYRHALTYPPVLSSTPLHSALSWADVFVTLPPRLQFSANPARFLEALLSDQELLTEFLFASFLPRRFYGGFRRYPGQMKFILEWLATLPQSPLGPQFESSHKERGHKRLRCLDAACGTGEDSYGLTKLLMETGFAPNEIRIEGRTLEPLEVWSATYCCFPYDQNREAAFRSETSRLFELGYQTSIRFRCADLTEVSFNPPDTLPPLQGEGRGGDGVDCGLSAHYNHWPHPPPDLPLERGGTKGTKHAQFLPSEEANGFSLFDLILCNGLLGGPIIHETEELERVVANLARLLAPGGLLLAADSFHGGWKSKCGNVDLKTLFSRAGLKSVDAGEGVGGLKR